jgi:hypothetical protein
VGKGRWQAPSYELSFCCRSGSNGKTQPYYWLATDLATKTRQRTKERQNREKLKTTEEILTLGFDCVTPILEIHLGNTMTWFMWGSNLFWWLDRHPFTLNQLGHLLCCWPCNLSIANFCLYTVVCSFGLTTWVVWTATGCVVFASGPVH